MKLWKKIAAAASLGVACTFASAAPMESWPDTGPNQWTSKIVWDDGQYVNGWQPLSYTHTITGSGGYATGTPLSGFKLSIDFSDDASDRGLLTWKSESAYIFLDGIVCGALTFPCSGDLSQPTTWAHDFGPLAANLGLYFDGTMNVLVTVSLGDMFGDFMVHRSTLTAYAANQVPEPGAIALLAIGLVGAGASLRKRRS